MCQLCAKLNDPNENEKTYKDVYNWWYYNETTGESFCDRKQDKIY
jgi:hypothetical protein